MAILDKMEEQLRPVAADMAPYPAKYITLASGEKMVVRQLQRDECDIVLATVKPLMTVQKDFYDIVAHVSILKSSAICAIA
jgi:hypothetical protein